jgi:CMP/dCMP kinase
MIITISGNPGSGKSTVAKILQKKLNAERVYAGGMFRELAREKNITLKELNEITKSDPEIDKKIDLKVAAKARELTNSRKIVIVEGRTQFHFLPESKKIFITVNPEEGAKRVWKDLQDKTLKKERNEDSVTSLKEVQDSIEKRDAEDARRYMEYYNIDHRKKSNYDFIVDSTTISAEEVAEKILKYLRDAQKDL